MPRPKKTDTPNSEPVSPFGKGEKLWLTYKAENGNVYYITSDVFRYDYFLYKEDNDKPTKTKRKAGNPTELYEFMTWGKNNDKCNIN